jgi:hypothetical protein
MHLFLCLLIIPSLFLFRDGKLNKVKLFKVNMQSLTFARDKF